MEEKVYLGAQWGTFQDAKGREVRYTHVFFMEPFPSDVGGSDYHVIGYKAGKYRLAGIDLVRELKLEPFDVVEVYFSSKGVVTKLVRKGHMDDAEEMEQGGAADV